MENLKSNSISENFGKNLFSDEVMNRWVIDQNFQEKLNQKDARFSFETREEKPVEKEITYLKKQA